MEKNKNKEIESLTKIGDDLQYEVISKDKFLSFQDIRTRITINFDIHEKDTAFTYLYVRTQSWDMPGERTDANEMLSVLLAAFLRIVGKASCNIVDIPHPVRVPETEVYARYLVLSQPFNSLYRINDEGLAQIKSIVAGVRYFEHILPDLLDWTLDVDNKRLAPQLYNWKKAEEWACKVAEALGENLNEDVQYTWRQNPTWMHYRSLGSGVTAYKCPPLAQALSNIVNDKERWKTIEGVYGDLFISDTIRNVIPFSKSRLFTDFFQVMEGKEIAIVVIPFDSMFVCAQGDHVLFLENYGGEKEFEIERECVRKRHENESYLLFPVNEFEWSENIDDNRFEEFTLDLLKHEEMVSWARKVSGSNERDGGRDIISEWMVPLLNSEHVSEKVPPNRRIKVLVQSKAYSGSVGKSKVRDIRDTVEHFEAQGYLLVTSGFLASSLTEHLERLRAKGQLWIDWWTRSEIEDRLKRHSDLLAQYSDIVTAKTRSE